MSAICLALLKTINAFFFNYQRLSVLQRKLRMITQGVTQEAKNPQIYIIATQQFPG